MCHSQFHLVSNQHQKQMKPTDAEKKLICRQLHGLSLIIKGRRKRLQ